MDVRKFFDSIDHAILLKIVARRFKDKTLLAIFEKIVHSYEANEKEGKGLPIGNLTSQYFANHYLAVLDHFIKNENSIAAYVRYMDDFVVWHDDLSFLKAIQAKIVAFLETELSLVLKTNLLQKASQGLSFLGFRLFPHKKLLSQRSKKRFKVKMRVLNDDLNKENLSEAKFQQRATALHAFVQQAYSRQYRLRIISSF